MSPHNSSPATSRPRTPVAATAPGAARASVMAARSRLLLACLGLPGRVVLPDEPGKLMRRVGRDDRDSPAEAARLPDTVDDLDLVAVLPDPPQVIQRRGVCRAHMMIHNPS